MRDNPYGPPRGVWGAVIDTDKDPIFSTHCQHKITFAVTAGNFDDSEMYKRDAQIDMIKVLNGLGVPPEEGFDYIEARYEIAVYETKEGGSHNGGAREPVFIDAPYPLWRAGGRTHNTNIGSRAGSCKSEIIHDPFLLNDKTEVDFLYCGLRNKD